jgi:ATP-dependent helicase HrpA
VIDDSGPEQARGTDLAAHTEPLRPKFAEAIAEVASDSGLARTGETAWVFGTIEATVTQKRAGHEVRVYPGLVDEGSAVGLRVFGSEDERDANHRRGVRRLLEVTTPSPTAPIVDGLSNADKLSLVGSPYPAVAELVSDCRAAVLQDLVDARPPVRSPQPFETFREEAMADHEERIRAVLADVLRILDAWRRVDKALSGRADMAMLPALTDMRSQLGRLVYRGFVGATGASQLRRYPTYLSALEQRREKLPGQVNRDRQLMDQIAEVQQAYLHQVEALPADRPPGARLRVVRWMLEEYRVSLWAQQLGTPYSVSDQRIRRTLAG